MAKLVHHATHGWIPSTPEAEEFSRRAVAAGIPAHAIAPFVTRIAAEETSPDEAAEALKLSRHESRRRAARAYTAPEDVEDDPYDEDARGATARQLDYLSRHAGSRNKPGDRPASVQPSGQLAYLRAHLPRTVHLHGPQAS